MFNRFSVVEDKAKSRTFFELIQLVKWNGLANLENCTLVPKCIAPQWSLRISLLVQLQRSPPNRVRDGKSSTHFREYNFDALIAQLESAQFIPTRKG